jgi:hypothetical protein
MKTLLAVAHGLLLICWGLLASPIAAQTGPLKWTFESRHVQGDEFELVFTAEIQKGWATYSQFLTSDEGPVPTTVTFESTNADVLGDGTEEGHRVQVEKDPVFDMPLVKFKDTFVIRKRVKVSDYGTPIVGHVTAMCCDDEKCLPPKDFEFSFQLRKP